MSHPVSAGTAPASPAQRRLISLDQFRGYTVAGMFLVNFLGSYAACPASWNTRMITSVTRTRSCPSSCSRWVLRSG